MYILLDKKSKKIIHTNPAPLAQNLSDKEVYHKFDSKKMEIGKTDGLLPEHFDINEQGDIIELTLSDLVDKGVVKLEVHQKIAGKNIVDKTVSELVKEGLLKLQPNQKVEKNHIVEKSLKELVDDGIIKLTPNQKIVENKIIEKSLIEQVKEGIIKIDEPFEYVAGDEIKKHSIKEIVDKKLLKTKKQCEKAILMIHGEIEQKIAARYTPGNEMKITKDYIDWMAETGSEKDERAITYKKMKNEIDKIKSEYAELKKRITEIKIK